MITKKAALFLILPLIFIGATCIDKTNYQHKDNWQHILILNDINGAYGAVDYNPEIKRVITESINKWNIALVISPGDLIAGQSLALNEQNIDDMWQGFNQHVLKPFQIHNIPFATSFGNHDGSKYQVSQQEIDKKYKYGTERQLAKQFWLTNKPSLNYISESHFPFFYSYEFANTIFVMIDASGFQMSLEELRLIEAMLTGHKDDKHLVVVGHLPLTGIAINRNKAGEVLESSDELMSLFKRYNVAMYISGHQHVYYPALHQGVFLLNSGGTPPRALMGQKTNLASNVTVLSIHADTNEFYTTTYDIDNLNKIDESKIVSHVEGFPFDLFKTVIRTQ